MVMEKEAQKIPQPEESRKALIQSEDKRPELVSAPTKGFFSSKILEVHTHKPEGEGGSSSECALLSVHAESKPLLLWSALSQGRRH